MLGIAVSERTVSRVLRTIRSRPPYQTWKTFLRNHLGEIVSVDFFTVPSIRLRVLFVFLVLEHRRREVLHFNVTDHPTSEWVSQQMVEAFADREVPRYLIRDRDGVYGNEVRRRLHSLQIEEVLTAPQIFLIGRAPFAPVSGNVFVFVQFVFRPRVFASCWVNGQA